MKNLEAYKMMFRFLEDRYFRSPSDELGALLSALSLLSDGKPADSAITTDWERAVEAVSSENPLTPTIN
jgi:hypothetical protein